MNSIQEPVSDNTTERKNAQNGQLWREIQDIGHVAAQFGESTERERRAGIVCGGRPLEVRRIAATTRFKPTSAAQKNTVLARIAEKLKM